MGFLLLFLAIGGILQGEGGTELAVVVIVGQLDGGRRGDGADLPDALCAAGELGLVLLHDNAHHVGGLVGAEEAQAGVDGGGLAVLEGEILGERITQAHYHAALDLSLQAQGVDGLAHVVGRKIGRAHV